MPSFWLSKTTLTKHHDECALAIASLKIIILIDWLPKFNHGVSSSPSLPAGRGDDDYKKGRLSVASYGTVYGTQYSLQYHTSIKHQSNIKHEHTYLINQAIVQFCLPRRTNGGTIQTIRSSRTSDMPRSFVKSNQTNGEKKQIQETE